MHPQNLRILVIFLAISLNACVDIKKVVTDITGDNTLRKKASAVPRRIRGFVGGPSTPNVAHRMAINVSEHIKQVMHGRTCYKFLVSEWRNTIKRMVSRIHLVQSSNDQEIEELGQGDRNDFILTGQKQRVLSS